MNGYEGMCMSWGKFLKPWQVRDKIIEWIFSQFTFKILWVTLTQKIITHRISKFTKGFEGMCISRGKFLKPWQVREIKLLSEFFPNSHSTFYEWLTQKIITHRVSKIHKWLWGDVYEQGKVSETMTSER